MTPHFTLAELRCKCGCGMLPQAAFMQKVEFLRGLYGKPMGVSSAARCPTHNAKVSTTGYNGPHTTGRAVDILVSREEALILLKLALQSDLFTGFGIHQKGSTRFLHLDDLPNGPQSPRPTIWSY